MVGAVDEVKGLIQLAGGIVLGGLALYKLTNVDEDDKGYETDESITYPERKERRVVSQRKPTPQAPEAPPAQPKKSKQAEISWRSKSEVAGSGVRELGSWKSSETLEHFDIEKESKNGSSSPSTAMSTDSDSESDASVDITPSWMSTKDPQLSVESEVVPQYTPSKLKVTVGADGGIMTDGNNALSKIAFSLSDSVFVYPLASGKEEFFGKQTVELASSNATSAFGHSVDVKVMETRAGAGAAVVGNLVGGSKTTVLTNSESLKSMIPSMFEIAEKRLPTVFHVATAKIDHSSLELSADYSDIMRVRESGFAMIGSGSSQEMFDMAVVSHVLAHKCNVPVLHFFDGVRGLNELSKTRSAQIEAVAEMIEKSQDSNPAQTFGLEAAADRDCPYVATVMQHVMKHLRNELGSGRQYGIFEYTGPEDAESVIVATGAAANVLVQCQSGSASFGVLNVRLLRPWSAAHFLQVLPKSVTKLCVLDQSGPLTPLFLDVASAMHSEKAREMKLTPQLIGGRALAGGLGFDMQMAQAVISNILAERPRPNFTVTEENYAVAAPVADADLSEILVWSGSSVSSAASRSVAMELGNGSGLKVQHVATQDPYSDIVRSDIRIGDKDSMLPVGYGIKLADVVVTNGSNIDAAVASVKKGGHLLINGDISAVSDEIKPLIVQKSVGVYTLERLSADTMEDDLEWLHLVAAIELSNSHDFAFLYRYIRNALRSEGKPELCNVAENISQHLVKHSRGIFQPTFPEVEDMNEAQSIGSSSPSLRSRYPKYAPRFEVGVEEEKVDESDKAKVLSQHELAWSLMFKESFGTSTKLRPSHHDVHFATVTKIQRLTPDEYSRNIFHMEFDISNTPIKYEIGDALGVFGHNDEVEVDKFIEQYGLDPNAFVRMPKRGALAKGHGDALELISVRNLLVQHLDLFGRPSKKFYTSLAQFAERRYEYLRLMHIGTDDTESFKLGIHETTNFADILLQYTSARPSIEELALMIPEIKARHYSISSSMKLCPRSVHLLVVAVDWETPMGRVRSGQCTRYLKNLKPGQVVSVDIQKSVLRLPPNPTQPIVMAGLGTGMAPFRAFIQERLWQYESGIKVGPCVLYFGARHKREEWLYGEELEKYEKMGLVKLGLAWSRDQKHKVYIQHKIKEDANLLKEYLGEKKGFFYLCGPTWPVPDVRDAIASGLTPEKVSKDGEVDVQAVEDLKEEGRYILEVY